MDLASELSTLKDQLAKARVRDKSLADIVTDALDKGTIVISPCNLKIKTRCKLRGHASKVYGLYWAHTPNHHQLLSASQDSTLILWDTCTRRKLKAIELQCAWTMTCATARPPNSNDLCASAGMDGLISVFSLMDRQSVDSGRLVRELMGHEGFIASIDFVQGSKQLISASADATCRLWDLASGTTISVFSGHQSEIYCLAVRMQEEGAIFVTGSADKSVKLWDVRTGNVELTIVDVHEADVNCIAFFPSGHALASGSDDCTAKLVDLRAAQVIGQLCVPHTEADPIQLNAKREQRLSMPMATNSSEATLPHSKSTDGLADNAERKQSGGGSVPITSVDFSNSGRLLFCGCDNFDCVVFDSLRGGIMTWLHGHENRIQCACIERRGLALATGSWDSTIRIWN